MQFFMLVLGKPKSSQADNKKKQKYIQWMRRKAIEQAGTSQANWLFSSEINLYSRIYWFHRGKRDGDADNIIKPIIDALETVIFKDDDTVLWHVAAKIDIDSDFTINSDEIPAEWYARLLEAINEESNPDIIFIEIGDLPEIHLYFGRDE